ncbi:MAG: hypothetical protein Q9183_000412, partial [Haloplaca sp. 2 TL-2023]
NVLCRSSNDIELQDMVLTPKLSPGALVVRKLCAALIAYFLRQSVSWSRCVLHVLCCLSQKSAITYDHSLLDPQNQAAMVVPTMGRDQLLTATWFATILVEEVSKTNPYSAKTSKYHDRVVSNLEDIVQLQHKVMDFKSHQDTALAEDGIACFKAWVTYSHGAWVENTTHLEPLRTLAPLSLELLLHDETFEATADCITEILGIFSQYFDASHLYSLALFLTRRIEQGVLSTLSQGEFGADSMAFVSLLLVYGDVSLQDLASQPDSPVVQGIMGAFLQLLACDGWAGAEDEVCTMTLEFWQSYIEHLIESLHGSDDEAEPWMDSAQQYVLRAIEKSWLKAKVPPDEVYAKWTSDQMADFGVFRGDVRDVLQSSYVLLGPSIFDRFADLAIQTLQSQAWFHLEAVLFCLNALAETISDEDVVDATLSTLFGSGLFASIMDAASPLPSKLRQTAVATISSFTAFFERNDQFLPAMLTFLFNSLQDPRLADVAAKAIFSTCSSCRGSLVPEVSAFLHQYSALTRWQGLSLGTKERVIGAIAAIIQATPTGTYKLESFGNLLDFVEQDIQVCQQSADSGRLEEAEESGLCALRCLVNMGKSMQEPDDVAIDLESEPNGHADPHTQLWASSQGRILQCLDSVNTALSNNGDIVEATCQILRTGYKERSPGPFVFSPKITEAFVASTTLTTPRLEQVLDTAGAMLAKNTRAKASESTAVATTFLAHLFHLVAAMHHDPTVDPEISSSCLGLASRFIPHYLHTFLDARCQGEVANFILFTTRCLMSQEIMPRRSAAFFWSSLFQSYELHSDVQALVDNILHRYGAQVTQVIVFGIAGDVPRSEIEALIEPLRKLAFAQSRAKQWISDALFSSTFPSSKITEAEKRVWLQQIIKYVRIRELPSIVT